MKKETGKKFNIKDQRPQVLLIGNGPVIMAGNAIPWSSVISSLGSEKFFGNSRIPYSLQASVAASHDDVKRRNKYEEIFKDYEYRDNFYISKLLEYPWDAVLTTNYTYDIEYCCNPGFVTLRDKAGSRYVQTTQTNGNAKGYGHILLRNYNRFEMPSGARDIWHIHGEIRNKSSIVLTHDEYARQTKVILQYLEDRRNEYQVYEKEILFNSWIDYFVLGDLHIVGLGMDFSEFDLWWLLNRRLREHTGQGILRYYNPESDNGDIRTVIERMKGKCESFGQVITPDMTHEQKNEQYKMFYEKLWKHLDDVIRKVENQ